MRNIYKVIIIALVFIISVFLLLLVVRPALIRSGSHLSSITDEEERNTSLNEELDRYLEDRDRYYLLNAEYQRLAMELPDNDDTLILTNELYEIARHTEATISSLTLTEVKLDEEEIDKSKTKEIMVDIILVGSYYQTLNFINTIEIMPRIMRVEDIIIQAPATDFDSLLTYISAKTYFINEYYRD